MENAQISIEKINNTENQQHTKDLKKENIFLKQKILMRQTDLMDKKTMSKRKKSLT